VEISFQCILLDAIKPYGQKAVCLETNSHEISLMTYAFPVNGSGGDVAISAFQSHIWPPRCVSMCPDSSLRSRIVDTENEEVDTEILWMFECVAADDEWFSSLVSIRRASRGSHRNGGDDGNLPTCQG
jgi:hypothetical protein